MENSNLDPHEKVHMQTMVSVLNSLNNTGYDTQFNIVGNSLHSLSTEKTFHPEEIKIASFYRFEGESNPEDNAIVYAIETNDGERGTLVDAYGIYNDANISTFIKKVEEIKK